MALFSARFRFVEPNIPNDDLLGPMPTCDPRVGTVEPEPILSRIEPAFVEKLLSDLAREDPEEICEV